MNIPTDDGQKSEMKKMIKPLKWLYPLTAFVMLGSSFNHIFVHEGISEFGADDIIDAWPILFLWTSAGLFLYGFVLLFVDARKAYTIGVYSSALGCVVDPKNWT